MARKATAMTAAAVKAAKPGRYGDGNGLYLLVRPNGGKFWLFRYTPQGGKMREMGLGRAGYADGEVPLADAREQAGELFKQVRAGIDPLNARVVAIKAKKAAAQIAAIKAKTFREVADTFMDAHEGGLSNAKHKMQWRNTMSTYAYPVIGDIPVAEIEIGEVLAILEPIWRVKPETATRVRGRIESVIDYARTLGWRTGDNPARWRGHLSNALPKRSKVAPVKHHPAMPWNEIGDFMALLRAQSGVAAVALQFTVLTAARTGEALGAKWSEVDLATKVWTVPASRTKAKKEHRVPLTGSVLHTLEAAQSVRIKSGQDVYIFPGATAGRPLSEMAMAMVLRRMKRGDVTVHGFRSSFSDWAAERTNYPRHVVEAALAHTIESKVEAAYRRGDLFQKRVQLMRAWATYCETPVGDAKIIPMGRVKGQQHA